MPIYKMVPLELCHAFEIMAWRYDAPYDFYDPPEVVNLTSYAQAFLDPRLQFHAVLDINDLFLGFCSYGPDGKVEGGDYSLPALDIGLGMKPDLTGQGQGSAFVSAIFDYGIQHYQTDRLRLTVANFNDRALKLYQHYGFSIESQFHALNGSTLYSILIKQ